MERFSTARHQQNDRNAKRNAKRKGRAAERVNPNEWIEHLEPRVLLSTAAITTITTPRNTPVDTATIVFDAPVTGFDIGDLSLTRNGGANLLTGSEQLTSNDNTTFTLANLGTLTNTSGDFVLSLNANNSGIVGTVNNDPLSNSPTAAFTVDTTAPLVTVDTLTTANTSPQITGTVNDPNATVVVTVNGNNFNAVNNQNGTFTLPAGTITPALTPGTFDVGVTATDTLGNEGADTTTNELVVNNNLPFATVTPVSPNPRTTPVDTITIVFTQPVTGFDVSDLSLTRNNGANLLTGSEQLTSNDNTTFTLAGLTGVTGTPGIYNLTLNPTGSNIVNNGGDALVDAATTTFTVTNPNVQGPTATIVQTPTPTNVGPNQITINFDEPVTGFDISDLALTRGGGANLLTNNQTLTTSDNMSFVLGNLSNLTTQNGNYTLKLTAAGSGIQDASNNAITGDATSQFVVSQANNGNTTFTESDGTEITLKLKGPGTAVFQDNGQGVAPSIVVTGSDATKSKLTITTKGGDKRGTVQDITINGGLKQLSGKNLDVTGGITSTEGVQSVTLGDIGGATQHTLTLGSNLKSFTARNVQNITLDAAGSDIKTFKVASWTDTDGTADTVTAATIKNLNSGDVFAANLALSGTQGVKNTLNTVNIKGPLSGASWQIASGNVNKITAGSVASDVSVNVANGSINTVKSKNDQAGTFSASSINSFTANGAITGGRLNVTNNVKTLSADSVANGFTANVGGQVNNVNVKNNFSGNMAASSIKSVNIKGDAVGANILSGANFGADGVLGGTDDTFGVGTIGTVNIRGSASNSILAAGLNPAAGTLNDGDETTISGGSINKLTIGGGTDANSFVAADQLPSTVSINGQTVQVPQGTHFLRNTAV